MLPQKFSIKLPRIKIHNFHKFQNTRFDVSGKHGNYILNIFKLKMETETL